MGGVNPLEVEMRCIQGRFWIVAITLCLVALGSAGCAGDEGNLNGFVERPTSAPSPTPVGPATDPVTNNNDEEVLQILSISPTSGPAGTQVTIVAEGFDPEKDTISIGDREFSSDAAPIAIEIPEDLAPGTYAVTLHRDDIKKSNKVNFEVTAALPEDPSEDDDADADDDAEEGNAEVAGGGYGVGICGAHPKKCRDLLLRYKKPNRNPLGPRGPKPYGPACLSCPDRPDRGGGYTDPAEGFVKKPSHRSHEVKPNRNEVRHNDVGPDPKEKPSKTKKPTKKPNKKVNPRRGHR